VDNCILTAGLQGAAVYCWSSGEAQLTCGDVYGNAGGDWVGCIDTQYGTAGNFSADPLLCAPADDNLTLQAGSPCLAGHHPAGESCGLIGAWGLGCPLDGVSDDPLGAAGAARRLVLASGAPNPFSRSTWIACAVPAGAGDGALPRASLAVYDPSGRRVRKLAPGGLGPGPHRESWSGDDDLGQRLPAGVYFIRLSCGDRSVTRAIGLLR